MWRKDDKKRYRWTRKIGLAGGILAIFVSAVAVTPAGASSTKPETSTIVVPLIASSAAEGSLVYPVAAHIFQQFGLTVQQPQSAAGTLNDSFVGGSVEIAPLAGTDPLADYSDGYPTQLIACTVNRTPFHVYGETSITSAKQIVGKKIGVTSIGGGQQLTTEAWLQQNGVNPASDTYVPLGSIPLVLAGLLSGSVDVGALSYPFYGTAAQNSNLHQIGLAYNPLGGLFVNPKWAKNNRNTIIAYLEGAIEGFWIYNNNQAKALPVLAQFLNDNLSNSTQAAAVLSGYQSELAPQSEPFEACPAQTFDSEYKSFITPDEQAATQHNKHGLFINNSYINQIISSGFYTKMQKKYGPLKGFHYTA